MTDSTREKAFHNSKLAQQMRQEMMMEEAISSAELAGADVEDLNTKETK